MAGVVCFLTLSPAQLKSGISLRIIRRGSTNVSCKYWAMYQSTLAVHRNVRSATGRRHSTELFCISEHALAKVLHLTFISSHLAVL